MAELTQQQKDQYWAYNVRLTAILLGIWFVVTYILGGLLAATLNEIVIAGFPLGYWIAAQGSLAVFVIEIAMYAKLMNAKDLEFGIREDA
jgi:putative solute:sodium symporter small subunit